MDAKAIKPLFDALTPLISTDIDGDDKKMPVDFGAVVSRLSNQWNDYSQPPYSPEVAASFRHHMLQVAVVALNAVVSYDRQTTLNGQPHYVTPPPSEDE